MAPSKSAFCLCFPWRRRHGSISTEDQRCNSDTIIDEYSKKSIPNAVIDPEPFLVKAKSPRTSNANSPRVSAGKASESDPEADSLGNPTQEELKQPTEQPADVDVTAEDANADVGTDVAPFSANSDHQLPSPASSASQETTYASASSNNPAGMGPASPDCYLDTGRLNHSELGNSATAAYFQTTGPLVELESPFRLDADSLRIRDIQDMQRQRYGSFASLAASQAVKRVLYDANPSDMQCHSFTYNEADASPKCQAQLSPKLQVSPMPRLHSPPTGFAPQHSSSSAGSPVPPVPPLPPRLGPLPPLLPERARTGLFGGGGPSRPLPEQPASEKRVPPFLDSSAQNRPSTSSLTAAIPGSLPSITQSSVGSIGHGLSSVSGPAARHHSTDRRSPLAASAGPVLQLPLSISDHGPESLSRFAQQHRASQHQQYLQHQQQQTSLGPGGMEPWTPERCIRGGSGLAADNPEAPTAGYNPRRGQQILGRPSMGGAHPDMESYNGAERQRQAYGSAGYHSSTAPQLSPGLRLLGSQPSDHYDQYSLGAAAAVEPPGVTPVAVRRLENALSGSGRGAVGGGSGKGLGGMAASPRVATPPPMTLMHARCSAPAHTFAASAYESARTTPLRLSSVPTSPGPMPLAPGSSPARQQDEGRDAGLTDQRAAFPLTPQAHDPAMGKGWSPAGATPAAPTVGAAAVVVGGADSEGERSSGGGGLPPRRSPALALQRKEAAKANEALLQALLGSSKAKLDFESVSVSCGRARPHPLQVGAGAVGELESLGRVQDAMSRLDDLFAAPQSAAAVAERSSSARSGEGGGTDGDFAGSSPTTANPNVRVRPW